MWHTLLLSLALCKFLCL
ncbi:unnamed protein product [Spirodela intermedia]|uniref:Uncharacterized protein n=1 Tax=Spirodela intermedia TaxID=51605 RepID=A0A7I8JCR6_SPIIN|nr:unnamed protein product [Spirodela intermedia]CAA6667293.1 unnamed protein product [Spirodela intermedia]